MSTFYNDSDPFCAAWLTELMRARHLPKGRIDARPIEEISAVDCAPTSHFFVGIGGWPYALRLAGWPPAEPVWTGSCPCQPFSVAGKRRGADDPRHLWPAWLRLIRECRPPTIFGEQVASRLGREWLAGVRTDLEALGYAVGAADLCAASAGAPHIRQRLWWCAADINRQRLSVWNERCESFAPKVVLNSWSELKRIHAAGAWAKWEAESGIRMFVDGIPGRLGLLRGYGNAIVPQVAAAFVRATIEALEREEKP